MPRNIYLTLVAPVTGAMSTPPIAIVLIGPAQ
jgi:hypothetical protein